MNRGSVRLFISVNTGLRKRIAMPSRAVVGERIADYIRR